MSWMKRAQPGEGAGAGPQPYGAPQQQPFANQPNIYANYPEGAGNVPQPANDQGQYWASSPPTQAPPQYNQQYGAMYQQEYPPNANQVYQQPPYNHNYTAPGYPNPHQGYQQNYYQNQPPQNFSQNRATNNDGWEDNWDWGWEESAKNAQRAHKNGTQHVATMQDRMYNNANVLEESFAPTSTSWNWASDENKPNKEPTSMPPKQVTEVLATLPLNSVENNMLPESNNTPTVNNGAPLTTDEVRTLSDKEVVKERMPNLALGKRFHLDNLTPQWSIESQMSQESSDGPQTHSESTYRSENQSRNSGSNSPGPSMDNSNFNVSQPGVDGGYTQNSEWSRKSDELTQADNLQAGSRKESHEELVHTMHDLSLVNRENPSSGNIQVSVERRSSQQGLAAAQPPSGAAARPPPPAISTPPPPAPGASPPSPAASPAASPARPPSAGSAGRTPPVPMQVAAPPPPTFPPPPNSQNPFKHAAPFANKSRGPFPPPAGGALTGRAPPLPLPYEANLETTPDNSERPDAPAGAGVWGPPPPHHVPDNLEVAPRSDRNEYLQTAHLSAEYGENGEFGRGAPPRGVGVGRHEPAATGEEPPPGLARMVPGRHTDDTARYRGRARATPAGEAAHYAPYGGPQEEPPEPRAAEPERAPDPPLRRSSADTDRDRPYDVSPRRESRDRDRDPDGRYSRPERDDRPGRERRDRGRDSSGDGRRKRRTAPRHRYETEDTDYCSDKERERRRHREGSYASRPPRGDEARRHEERASRARRHGGSGGGEGRERRRDHERSYRDIDPSRKHGTRRRERDDDERRRVRFSRDAATRPRPSDSCRSEGETYSSPSRTATDEEADRRRDRRPRHDRSRRTLDPYYDGYGAGGAGAAFGDPYLAQRAQYEYYARLRATDPAAYMQLYKRLMAPHQDPLEGYMGGGAGVYGAREERGSVHSGRSSATGLKGHDTYYAFRHDSLRDAPSLRTDLSDRDLNTELSLPTNLESSTVRSERMTPHRFSTAHVKGSISSRHVVVVRPSWPVDGYPATVQLLSLPHLLHHDPVATELHNSPGPLLKGVTHKKSVIEYCLVRVRNAAREAVRDVGGYGLVWELLALLLRQNGVVVGSDIAELLMKNTREHEYKMTTNKTEHNGSRRDSMSGSGSGEEARCSPDLPRPSAGNNGSNESTPASVDEKAALDKFREYLLYGNRQEALEWAMSCGLWGHALHLAAHGDRRTRTAAAARFLAATPRTDPLHTLYATLAAALPPAATCVSEERWADWRPHAAIILANSGARPDHDSRTLTQLGDSLASRGLVYSAQFCYVVGGVPFARHPLAPLCAGARGFAPPRLSLLLAEPRARSLHALATTRAILATEIYEYALSLNQDYVIPELQVYKFMVASRLIDCGQYERALAYVEQAARAVTRAPRDYSPLLVRQLAEMADRLKYHDPALLEDAPLLEEASSEGSPRHQQWLHDVQTVAHMMQAETHAQQTTPQHAAPDCYGQQVQYSWEQAQPHPHQEQAPPPAPYVEPEETAEYSHQYQYPEPGPAAVEPPPEPEAPPYAFEEWQRTEEHHAQQYADPATYWHHDNTHAAYGQPSAEGGGEEENPRPTITMPGARAHAAYGDEEHDQLDNQQHGERETDTPKSSRAPDHKGKEGGGKGGGWLGGILTKLSLRPPNQMILPDDKNPTIVWDAEKKRWKNLDGGEEAEGAPPPPPPRVADLPRNNLPNTSTPNPSPGAPPAPAAPPAPPVSNIFKMQKGRHIKKSYVDVFNPSGAPSRPLPSPADVLGPSPALPHNPTYFVPTAAPSTQNELYDPRAIQDIRSGI